MSNIHLVESHFGIRLKHEYGDEWRSLDGCPECGDGGKGSKSDRFRVWDDDHPRYWCRKCGFQGWVDEINGEKWRDLSFTERRQRMIGARERARKEAEKQRELRVSALRSLRANNKAQEYHDQLNQTARTYWHNAGFTPATINGFQLGYCPACPLDPQGRPSVTIPVYAQSKLWDIRHRILGAQKGKYRPQRKHLPSMLFNADNLLSAPPAYLMLVEGEKKSIACTQAGWWSVGIMGMHRFQEDWIPAFRRFETVYIVLDPDVPGQAQELAAMIGDNARPVMLPDKLDDWINPYSGNVTVPQAWAHITRSQDGRDQKRNTGLLSVRVGQAQARTAAG